ncbi:uncharacterized protein LOC101766408 isoform X1 [Setaria italica]|uniref:uncharacterized protein LOC101766408 isoform X1 n=1 Tax=Setaria italica TaxID=4555 RepID=UPI0003508E4B|nr:uncharacterized protein LOC101766408 isoform X1 [Setaria italica]
MGTGGSDGGGGDRQAQPLLGKLSESDEHLVKRTGTVWTAMAHIITAVIGSGVLSLAWSVAQLGWAGGPAAMVFFAGVTAVQSSLIADCYISHDPERGVVRNRTYVDAVRLYLDLPFNNDEKPRDSWTQQRCSCRIFQRTHLSIFFCHRICNMSQGDSEGQLLPQVWPRRAVLRGRRRLLHAPLRPRAGGPVPDTRLPRDDGALRLRRRHVLLLLLRRRRPRRRQSHLERGDHGRHRRHPHGVHDAEGVAGLAGRRRHPVRLPLLLGAAGDRGHAAVAAAGERDDEDGDEGEHRDHRLLLPLLRVPRLRGVRRRHPGQPPHGLRLLRALLAHRPRQPLHRPPPPRRLPGVHAAGVRVRRPPLRRRGGGGAGAGAAPGHPPRERVPAVLPDGVRGGDHRAGRVVPLLQPGDRAARRLHLLAARHLLPRGDVPREEQGGAVEQAVARHPRLQLRLPPHLRVRLLRLRRGGVWVGDELSYSAKAACSLAAVGSDVD